MQLDGSGVGIGSQTADLLGKWIQRDSGKKKSIKVFNKCSKVIYLGSILKKQLSWSDYISQKFSIRQTLDLEC